MVRKMKLEESKIQSKQWLKNTYPYKFLAAIPIPAFIVLIVAMTPFDNRVLFEPLWLLSILNTVFVFAIYFAVAYISAKSYLASGSLSIFLLGCGMLAFGSAALLGGWLIAAPGGINVSVALFNIGALFGSIFHLMGAMLTSMRVNPELNSKRRKWNLTLAYPGVLILVILLAIASLQSITPAFFIQGTGPTPLRQVVLGTAAVLFSISALLFIRLYSRLTENYLYWYSLALMLVAIDLFASLFVHTVGSPFNWAARLPLYLGGIYFLNAIFVARRTARTRGTSTEEAVANFFREPEENFRVLVETANDAIVSLDNEGRVLLWNSAAEKIFSYNRSEAVGSILGDLIIPDSYADILKKEMKNLTVTGKSTQIRKIIEMEAKRKDGKAFPVEFSISARETSDGWIYTGIIRDITRRKRAEEALRESEARFRSVLDDSRDVIYRLNVQTGRYEYISPSAETVVGFSPDELMALDAETSLAMIYPDDLPAMRAMLACLEDTGKGEIEYRQQTKNGDYRWISNNMSLVKDISGRPLYRNGNIRDITERKRADEALRESAAKYKLLTESILDTFTAIDHNLKFTYWNRAAEELVGISANEALGKTVIEVFGDNEITRRAFGYYRECVKTRQPIRYETGNVIRGRKYDLELRLYPTNDGVSIIGRDITERKMAEKALQKAHDELELRVQERTAELQETNEALLEREASYRELTESIDDLFYAMDRDLRYTYWNKASESLSGILAKDAIGKSIYELFPDVKGTKVEQIYIEVLKTQQPERFESEYKLGDKKFIFEINAYPTRYGLSVIAKDITEKKKLEAQLLRAQRMESIGTLAGGIAHDLNNVLTPMMLSLEMLKQKFKDEQSQRLLTILEKNSQRGADLIKQVLSFARGVEGERNPLQAKHLISEIEKIAKETFPRNIEIRTDIPKDLFTISGDATQLHQVIMNLCVNARDAMPDGGILSISAENFFIDETYVQMHTEAKVGSYVAIAVSDTGTGIPPDILDRIFEPFFTTKEVGKGTGLGLSTSHAIVKSHGGFINVYSEVGKGTKFSIYLPAIKTRTEIQNAQEQKLELFTGHGESVLIAEDEDSVREVTVSTLEKYGYKVLAANNGADAVVLYAQNKDKVKVILMDMMMPVMDGHASIRAIHKINPEVKIIAVSGLAEKEKLAEIASSHTKAFLPKPYTAEKLLKTIHEVMSEE